MKKYSIGYTTGVFDMFHIGHLNLLRRAKSYCDHLIVGVTIDALVSYKGQKAIIPFEDRIEIVKSIKYVDQVVPQANMNKLEAWERYKFNIMFVGSDWQGTNTWNTYEKNFKDKNVIIEYLPYTHGISSTYLRSIL